MPNSSFFTISLGSKVVMTGLLLAHACRNVLGNPSISEVHMNTLDDAKSELTFLNDTLPRNFILGISSARPLHLSKSPLSKAPPTIVKDSSGNLSDNSRNHSGRFNDRKLLTHKIELEAGVVFNRWVDLQILGIMMQLVVP